MKNRIFGFLFAAAITVGLLSACAGTPAAGGTNSEPLRTISVTGTGKAVMSPDLAYITVGVHTEADNVGDALAQNTAQAQAVTDSLSGFGVERKDIQTTAFNVFPQQQYGPQGEMLGIKYVVDNSVYVTVRDLAQLGKVLDAVVKSGANNINGIQFDVTDRTAAIAEARKAAMDDAKMQADELAAAAGAQLGEVQSISIYSSNVPYPMYDAKGGGMMANSAVPISAGQLTISVDISVSYTLK